MKRYSILFALSSLVALAVCPALFAGPAELGIEVGAAKVGKYEKVEFNLRAAPACNNPFDPEEADLSIEIQTPSGKTLSLPAFYYQHYLREDHGRNAEWLYPAGPAVWKARFAPAELGSYSCRAVLKDRNGAQHSSPVRFECVPSGRRGFIRVSARDPRFLEFSEGQPYFAIGHNVATHPHTFWVEAAMKKMAANGANFCRVWACCNDYGLAIEARKSAWGFAWTWHPPITVMPGEDGYYSDRLCVRLSGPKDSAVTGVPARGVALRPNTRYRVSGTIRTDKEVEVCMEALRGRVGDPLPVTRKPPRDGWAPQWLPFERQFTSGPNDWWLQGGITFRLGGEGTAWLMDLSLCEAESGVELPWGADVNRPVRGYYNLPDCAMLDAVIEAAEQNGIYLQLCLLARDIYLPRIVKEESLDYDQAIRQAKKLIRYAVARWGYSTHVALWEYWNEMDPHRRTGRFYAEMGQYLEKIDPYRHLRTVSLWGPPEQKDWTHPMLDVADLHWYLTPSKGELYKDEVAGVLDRARYMRKGSPGKPAIFSEYGLADNAVMRSEYVPQDREYVHLHNALWASALSGISSTVCSWWWVDLDKADAYRHYRPLTSFVADIPFTSGKLREASAAASDKRVRVVGLQGEQTAHLWLFNTEATWWKLVAEKATPAELVGLSVTVSGLEPGTYRCQWWDTYEGKVLKEEKPPVANRSLKLVAPGFARDIACKLIKLDAGQ